MMLMRKITRSQNKCDIYTCICDANVFINDCNMYMYLYFTVIIGC